MKKYKGTAKTKKLSGIPKMVSNVNTVSRQTFLDLIR